MNQDTVQRRLTNKTVTAVSMSIMWLRSVGTDSVRSRILKTVKGGVQGRSCGWCGSDRNWTRKMGKASVTVSRQWCRLIVSQYQQGGNEHGWTKLQFVYNFCRKAGNFWIEEMRQKTIDNQRSRSDKWEVLKKKFMKIHSENFSLENIWKGFSENLKRLRVWNSGNFELEDKDRVSQRENKDLWEGLVTLVVYG